MIVAVIGAGRMGRVIGHDLLKQEKVEHVAFCDIKEPEWLEEAGPKASFHYFDLNNIKEDFLKSIDVIVSSADYKFNLELTKIAIKHGIHMCDLGGNFDVVKKQIKLSEQAKEAGITIIPDCGLAPGMACMLAANAINEISENNHISESSLDVKIRVGGLPRDPIPPLNYHMPFSARGLINEYIEPCVVLRDGDIQLVESLKDVEDIFFYINDKEMTLEAFNTSGGTSTLPETFKGKVRNMDYKTIRYQGHCSMFAAMKQIGLLNEGFRGVLEILLDKNITNTEPDIVLLKVIVQSKTQVVIYQMRDDYHRQEGQSAMARTTGLPTAAIAYMLGTRELPQGVVPGELALPLGDFIDECKARGLNIIKSENKYF